MVNIIPMNGYSLVKPYKEPHQGGFQLPDSVKDQPVKGEVLAVNSEPFISEYGAIVPCPDIKVGDVIVHRSWGHQDVTVQGEKFRLVKHIDVVGKLDMNGVKNETVQSGTDSSTA